MGKKYVIGEDIAVPPDDAKLVCAIGRYGCHNSCIVKKRQLFKDSDGNFFNVGSDSFGIIKDTFPITVEKAEEYIK
jgi:hypothetical protein